MSEPRNTPKMLRLHPEDLEHTIWFTLRDPSPDLIRADFAIRDLVAQAKEPWWRRLARDPLGRCAK